MKQYISDCKSDPQGLLQFDRVCEDLFRNTCDFLEAFENNMMTGKGVNAFDHSVPLDARGNKQEESDSNSDLDDSISAEMEDIDEGEGTLKPIVSNTPRDGNKMMTVN